MRIPFIALLSLAACAESVDLDNDPEEGSIEEGVLLARPVVISIHADAAPALVAYREGVRGAWRAATRISATEYQARVRGPYTMIAACDLGYPSVQMVSQTPADGADLQVYCAPYQELPYVASGTMVQPGQVSLGGWRRSSTRANWAFELFSGEGDKDLVAATADRVHIQRALPVHGNLTLAPLDLSSQGSALDTVTFTPTNSFAGETPYVSTFIMSPRIDPQAQIYSGPMTGAKVAPAAVLGGDVTQEVSLRSQLVDDTHFLLRSARHPFRAGDATSVTFWDPFTGYHFAVDQGVASVSWRARADMDYAYLSLSSANGGIYDLFATRNYLQATRVRKLTLDLSAPGILPQWLPTFDTEYQATLSSNRGTTDRVGFSYTETFNLGVYPPALTGAKQGARAARELRRAAVLPLD